jgi:hypothetical protein
MSSSSAVAYVNVYCPTGIEYLASNSAGMQSCTVYSVNSNAPGNAVITPEVVLQDISEFFKPSSGVQPALPRPIEILGNYIESGFTDALAKQAPSMSVRMNFAATGAASVFSFTLDFQKGLSGKESLLQATVSSGVNTLFSVGVGLGLAALGFSTGPALLTGIGLTLLASAVSQYLSGGKVDNLGDGVYKGLEGLGISIGSFFSHDSLPKGSNLSSNSILFPIVQPCFSPLPFGTYNPIRDLLLGPWQAASENVVNRRDPLILDLDGNGIQTESITGSNVYFDLDSNGFSEHINPV